MKKAPDYLNDLNRRIASLRLELERARDPRQRFPLLDELSFHLKLIDPAEGARFARQQIRLAEEVDDRHWIMRGYIRLANMLEAQSRYAEARRAFRRSWKLLHELPDDPAEKAYVCRNIGQLDYETGDTRSAVEMLGKSLEQGRRGGDEREVAATLTVLGNIYTDLGLFAQAIEAISGALKIYEARSFTSGVAVALATLGAVSEILEDDKGALEYYRQGLKLHQSVGNKAGEATLRCGIASVMTRRGEYARARRYYDDAMTLYKELGDRFMYGNALAGIAALHRSEGDQEKALHSLTKARRIFEQIGNVVGIANVDVEIGELHVAREKYEEGIVVLQKALEVSDKTGFHSSLIRIHRLLARAFEMKRDLKVSLHHYKIFMKLEREILSSDVQRAVIACRFDDGLREMKEERERHRDRSRELERKSERSATALSSLAGQVAEHDRLLDDLRERLAALRRTDRDVAPLIENILNELQQRNAAVEAWSLFESNLRMLAPDFVGRLIDSSAPLTPAEVRIALLLRINLSNKEIGALLNISDRTVDTHRTNIRKKLGVERGRNLVGLLRTL